MNSEKIFILKDSDDDILGYSNNFEKLLYWTKKETLKKFNDYYSNMLTEEHIICGNTIPNYFFVYIDPNIIENIFDGIYEHISFTICEIFPIE